MVSVQVAAVKRLKSLFSSSRFGFFLCELSKLLSVSQPQQELDKDLISTSSVSCEEKLRTGLFLRLCVT